MKYPLLLTCLVVSSLQVLAQESKTYPASPFPDRVILGWKGDAAHSQAVNWRTDSTITEGMAAIHEADASPDFQPNARLIKAKNLPTTIEGRTVINHEVNFTNLKPSTQYVYRVGDGKYWSEWFHFKTASDKTEPVSFIYFGDAQNDLRSMWSRTIRGAFSNVPKANFIIHAGDLINRANADNEWGEWFEAGGWINGMIPSLSTPGNHEYYRDQEKNYQVSQQWRPQFALPENGPEGLSETAYHIDYQGIKLISIDSQGAMLDSAMMIKQAAWLETVLQANTNKWTVVFHHHPIYSTKNGRDNDDWRLIMEPLYKKYGVDLVLQGHDHTYGRGINMPEGQSRKKPDGPIYVVSVSGPKMYDIGLQNWMDRAASNTQLYQIITVDNDALSYKAFTVTDDLYDHFELKKDKKGVNTLVEMEHTLQMKERLELPAKLQERFKDEELKEYNERFKAYKKRKGLK
ncbi:purple acid phosphatase family protein [Dyadobacter tibetensis]|uniref:purple acid phosphatase family protein n=1 Tax=Dyadobacter tibetensis TaxID=1211851 RepID=UPI0004713C68|nr:metallophosphoesterase family protein [Dyadobacter tibetensis]